MKTRNLIKYAAAALIPIVQGCMDGSYNSYDNMPAYLKTSLRGYNMSIPDAGKIKAYAAVKNRTGIEARRGRFYGAAGYYSEMSSDQSALDGVLKEADRNNDKRITPEEAFQLDLKRSGFKRR